MKARSGWEQFSFSVEMVVVVIAGATVGYLLVDAVPLIENPETNRMVGMAIGVVAAMVLHGRLRPRG